MEKTSEPVTFVMLRGEKEKIVTLGARQSRKRKSHGNEMGYNFVCGFYKLLRCVCVRAFVSPLCLSLCPLSRVKVAFKGAGELFKSCV